MLTWLESATDMLFDANAALLDNFIPVNSNCDIDGCDGVADFDGWAGCDLTSRNKLHLMRVTMCPDCDGWTGCDGLTIREPHLMRVTMTMRTAAAVRCAV